MREKVKNLLQETKVDREVLIKGWVRTKRESKNVAFIAINDGSTINNIQVVVDVQNFPSDYLVGIHTGGCLAVTGTLVQSQGKGQSTEILAKSIEIYGGADPETYPLQKKGHTLEFLREIAHLRPRTNTFGAILRMRHAAQFAVHQYFNSKGFQNLHTPIITGADCEGAGEMFKVTTLDLNNAPKTETGEIDYSQDFFGKETCLTVSGQLNGELGAMALGDVYTFGPTFRAENSNTSRHLAEFWMIEPEMAFAELEDNMFVAEEFLKYLIQYILNNCEDDLKFLNEMYDKELINRLNFVLANPFQKLTYTEAIEILINSKQKFEYKVEWGTDLQSEHERYLVEKHFMKPVILIDYPKDIKAFYMKLNSDGKTVRAMDVLFPGIGEIIGGSQREENYEKLLSRVEAQNMDQKELWWYLDTRRFGTAPHSGFGLGFERFMLFITGMSNIRDVIPFPRTPMSANF